MGWNTNVLVIANRTADSPELLNALCARAARGPSAFTLLVPKRGADRLAAELALEAALIRMREAGLRVEGHVGDSDPLVAVQETWDPCLFDEVVVSTLPTHSSRWLGIDLPHRVATSPAPAWRTSSLSRTSSPCADASRAYRDGTARAPASPGLSESLGVRG